MNQNISMVAPSDWLKVLDDEYLKEYLSSGGSAVKVLAVPDSMDVNSLVSDIERKAEQYNYENVFLDPLKASPDGKKPDLHRIDKFFFAVTQNTDWIASSRQLARNYLLMNGMTIPDSDDISNVEMIAEINNMSVHDLMNIYQTSLSQSVLRNQSLSNEFRIAITSLIRSVLLPDTSTPNRQELILGWFEGKTQPGAAAALKKVRIFEKINITNARVMLQSYTKWLPDTGKSGLVITLDLRPYEYKKLTAAQKKSEAFNRYYKALNENASPEELRTIVEDSEVSEPAFAYTDLAYFQMLTMIRRFIDEIDIFQHFLLVVLTTPNFYKNRSLDPSVKRCFYDYDALQTRIGLEVFDAARPNPTASLVFLEGCNG